MSGLRRRLVLNAAVVVIAAALAATAWLELGRETGAERIAGIEPDAVRVIRVQKADGALVRMERTEGGWRIVEPVDAPASAFHVDQLLDLLRQRSRARYGTHEVDPEALGLIPPRAQLAFNGTGVAIGDATGGLRHVRVGDGDIHLVDDRFMPLLQGQWWNFLDRHLLGDGAAPPVALRTPELTIRRAEGDWESDGALPAEAIGPLMAAWRDVEALVARPLEDLPADARPVAVVELADGSRRRFAAQEEEGEVRLVDPDAQVAYVLSRELRRYLLTGEQP